METKSTAESLDKKLRNDVVGHKPSNSKHSPGSEPLLHNKISMEDVQQSKESEVCKRIVQFLSIQI